MARRNKDDNVAILILIIIGAMAWGIYVAVKALINLNERFIESVSNPAGVIGLFFGLLIAVALIIRVFIYRGFRKKATDLAKKEQAFDETVSSEVACKLYQEKQQLAVQWTEFHNARNKASRALQRIVDSAYKFKVKTLLSGTTVNNWQSKYDQLRKERDAYAAISEKITFLELEDNADWEAVKQQFLDKVQPCWKKRRKKKSIRLSLSVRLGKKNSVRMNWNSSSAKRKKRSNALLSSSVYWRKLFSPLKAHTGKSWKDSVWSWSRKSRTYISSMNAPNPWPSSPGKDMCISFRISAPSVKMSSKLV